MEPSRVSPYGQHFPFLKTSKVRRIEKCGSNDLLVISSSNWTNALHAYGQKKAESSDALDGSEKEAQIKILFDQILT